MNFPMNGFDLSQYLLKLIQILKERDLPVLYKYVFDASRYAYGASMTEYFLESRMALLQVLKHTPSALSKDEFKELQSVIVKIEQSLPNIRFDPPPETRTV